MLPNVCRKNNIYSHMLAYVRVRKLRALRRTGALRNNGLMNNVDPIAQHARVTFWHISFLFSSCQRREMSEFEVM